MFPQTWTAASPGLPADVFWKQMWELQQPFKLFSGFDLPLPGIVPARADTTLLTLSTFGEDTDVRHVVTTVPILRWLTSDAHAFPITKRGINGRSLDARCVVEFPKGQVVSANAGRWKDRETWLEELTG